MGQHGVRLYLVEPDPAHLTATESSIINGTMLIWIPILAILFLGETITPKEIVGLVITGVGTLLIQLRKPSVETNKTSR